MASMGQKVTGSKLCLITLPNDEWQTLALWLLALIFDLHKTWEKE
jgi:hypothetical protein